MDPVCFSSPCAWLAGHVHILHSNATTTAAGRRLPSRHILLCLLHHIFHAVTSDDITTQCSASHLRTAGEAVEGSHHRDPNKPPSTIECESDINYVTNVNAKRGASRTLGTRPQSTRGDCCHAAEQISDDAESSCSTKAAWICFLSGQESIRRHIGREGRHFITRAPYTQGASTPRRTSVDVNFTAGIAYVKVYPCGHCGAKRVVVVGSVHPGCAVPCTTLDSGRTIARPRHSKMCCLPTEALLPLFTTTTTLLRAKARFVLILASAPLKTREAVDPPCFYGGSTKSRRKHCVQERMDYAYGRE